jgi:hypothetical protein
MGIIAMGALSTHLLVSAPDGFGKPASSLPYAVEVSTSP